jgi:hypothetical protein
MSQPPKSKRVYGNRYTGSRMTAREAQTLAGILKKMRVLERQMEARGLHYYTIKLEEARNLIFWTVQDAGRGQELT